MLSIANEVDPLIFCGICFVYDTNYIFPTLICLKEGLLETEGLRLENVD